ncbi:MAG: hypothetical protein ACXADC_16280 [Candidatus Thorarchaeota archaeon]
MSRWTIKGKVIGFSLLILFGSNAAVALLGYPYYSFTVQEYTHFNPYAFTVTSDEPRWNETSDRYSVIRFGIADLDTNSTPVNLFIIDSYDEMVLSLSNVTKISNVTVTCFLEGESTIVVERLGGDAEVTLTVMTVLLPPPPPTVSAISPVPMIMFFSFIAAIGFILLIFVKGASRWKFLRGRRQSMLIAMLMLLSIILTTPYVTGSVDGSFKPVEQTEALSGGSRMFMLDSGSPTDYLEIDTDVENALYSIRVGPQVISGMSYRMVIQDTNGKSYLEATFINSTNWLIEGATAIGANCTLLIERAGSDVDLELSYSVTQTVIRPEVDPTSSMFLASVGVGAIILALLLGLMMEPKVRTHQS